MSAALLRYAPVLLVPVLAGLAAFYLKRQKAAPVSDEPAEEVEGEVPMGSGKWSMKTGVIMPEGGSEFMDALAELLSFEPVVTSGIRTDAEQAKAMQAKEDRYRAGSTASSDDLLKLYKDDAQIQALRAAPYDEWAGILKTYREAGHPVSNHQDAPGPDALDLRTKDRSADDIAAMQAAVSKLGGTPLVESDHMHVKLPSSLVA